MILSCILLVGCMLSLAGCSVPRVSAADRLFLPLQAEILDRVVLPKQTFAGVPVGGLSAIAYDRPNDRFYALSDDRSVLGPARFYTLQIPVVSVPRPDPTPVSSPGSSPGSSAMNSAVNSAGGDRPPAILKDRQGENSLDKIQIGEITITAVTTLKDETGTPYPPESIDPEGLVLTPQNTVWVASEGETERGTERSVLPEVSEYDLATGVKRRSLPLPSAYLPAENPADPPRGIRNNLGFEALAMNPTGAIASPVEPYRLFMATESNLAQDLDLEVSNSEVSSSVAPNSEVSSSAASSQDHPEASAQTPAVTTAPRSRFLHFLIGDGPPFPISEHLYPVDPDPPQLPGLDAFFANGIVELVALDQGGHFLSLERTFGADGFGAKVFQVAMGAATDTAGYPSYRGDLIDTEPARKTLLLDFGAIDWEALPLSALDLPPDHFGQTWLDNLEGMTLGPRLPDGSQSLILISDDNFRDLQQTQIWLVRLSQPMSVTP